MRKMRPAPRLSTPWLEDPELAGLLDAAIPRTLAMPRETAKRTKNWMIPEEPLWDRRAVRSSWFLSCQDSILTG